MTETDKNGFDITIVPRLEDAESGYVRVPFAKFGARKHAEAPISIVDTASENRPTFKEASRSDFEKFVDARPNLTEQQRGDMVDRLVKMQARINAREEQSSNEGGSGI